MFKRFQVIDLFHGNKLLDVKEWIPVDQELPNARGIFKVRSANGDEVKAYYCEDQCMPLMKYFNNTPSYWWKQDTKIPLYDVTHWGKHD